MSHIDILHTRADNREERERERRVTHRKRESYTREREKVTPRELPFVY